MTVTVADVKSVIDTKVSDPDITSLIAVAVQLTLNCSTNWTTTQTDMVNTWVAAHLLAVGRSRLPAFDKLGDAQRRWDASNLSGPALGLFDTSFGRTALSLDDSGCLAQLGRMRAKAVVL